MHTVPTHSFKREQQLESSMLVRFGPHICWESMFMRCIVYGENVLVRVLSITAHTFHSDEKTGREQILLFRYYRFSLDEVRLVHSSYVASSVFLGPPTNHPAKRMLMPHAFPTDNTRTESTSTRRTETESTTSRAHIGSQRCHYILCGAVEYLFLMKWSFIKNLQF